MCESASLRCKRVWRQSWEDRTAAAHVDVWTAGARVGEPHLRPLPWSAKDPSFERLGDIAGWLPELLVVGPIDGAVSPPEIFGLSQAHSQLLKPSDRRVLIATTSCRLCRGAGSSPSLIPRITAGGIPPELVELGELETLDLAVNRLRGERATGRCWDDLHKRCFGGRKGDDVWCVALLWRLTIASRPWLIHLRKARHRLGCISRDVCCLSAL